jgi:hypothetical protein
VEASEAGESLRRHAAGAETISRAPIAANHRAVRHLPRLPAIRYFLFIGGSSMNAEQIPFGLTFEPFFTILIFIVILYATAPAMSWASATIADSMLLL